MGEKRNRRNFDEQFTRDVVCLMVEGGQRISQVSRDLGVGVPQLRRWRQQFESGKQSSAGNGKAAPVDSAETENLRREPAQMEDARDPKKSVGRLLTTARMMCQFITKYAHEHSIALMCGVLHVSRSGFVHCRSRAQIPPPAAFLQILSLLCTKV